MTAIGVLAALGWAFSGLLVLAFWGGVAIGAGFAVIAVLGALLWHPERDVRCDRCGNRSEPLGHAGALVVCLDVQGCEKRHQERHRVTESPGKPGSEESGSGQ